MILRYYGHSFFVLELSDGRKIAFDPYGDFYRYPKRKLNCDLCLISHHHEDHDGVQCLAGKFEVIDKPGFQRFSGRLSVEGVETAHDEQGGTLRGSNTVFVVEAENLRIAHAGDLGHVLTHRQITDLGKIDVLLLPVGGFYTIDAEKAEEVRRQLNPKVTIPMHYRTEYNPEMPIAPLAEYLRQAQVQSAPMPLMRFTDADIDERNPIEVLEILP